MNEYSAWIKFEKTGSVSDYLAYRMGNRAAKEQSSIEVCDRRTDNKREQCR